MRVRLTPFSPHPGSYRNQPGLGSFVKIPTFRRLKNMNFHRRLVLRSSIIETFFDSRVDVQVQRTRDRLEVVVVDVHGGERTQLSVELRSSPALVAILSPSVEFCGSVQLEC